MAKKIRSSKQVDKRNNVEPKLQGKNQRPIYQTAGYILVLLCATLLSLFLLSKMVQHSMPILLLYTVFAIIGFFMQKRFRAEFGASFKRIFRDVEFPILLTKVSDYGMDIAFTCFLAAIGISPTKDLVSHKFPTFQIDTLFWDLTLVIMFFSILPLLYWVFYKGLKDENLGEKTKTRRTAQSKTTSPQHFHRH